MPVFRCLQERQGRGNFRGRSQSWGEGLGLKEGGVTLHQHGYKEDTYCDQDMMWGGGGGGGVRKSMRYRLNV